MRRARGRAGTTTTQPRTIRTTAVRTPFTSMPILVKRRSPWCIHRPAKTAATRWPASIGTPAAPSTPLLACVTIGSAVTWTGKGAEFASPRHKMSDIGVIAPRAMLAANPMCIPSWTAAVVSATTNGPRRSTTNHPTTAAARPAATSTLRPGNIPDPNQWAPVASARQTTAKVDARAARPRPVMPSTSRRLQRPDIARRVRRSFKAPIRGHLRCMAPTTFTDTLADACTSADAWPLPAQGRTLERWRALSAVASGDLILGRLVEAHADARAILDELDARASAPGERWGVWAAEGPDAQLVADRGEAGGDRHWTLTGTKPWCSGATLLTHALVTAMVDGARGLFAVDLDQPAVRPLDPQWVGAGMRDADTRTVAFNTAAAVEIGPPGAYLTRPGFWIGAIGVAACWYGGLLPLIDVLSKRVSSSDDPHAAAHLGAIYRDVAAARALLREAAAVVDAEPRADHIVLARTVRSAVERAARTGMDQIARATGPAPLAHDAAHAQRIADLSVYIRQHHAERDLAALGRDVSGSGVGWTL